MQTDASNGKCNSSHCTNSSRDKPASESPSRTLGNALCDKSDESRPIGGRNVGVNCHIVVVAKHANGKRCYRWGGGELAG